MTITVTFDNLPKYDNKKMTDMETCIPFVCQRVGKSPEDFVCIRTGDQRKASTFIFFDKYGIIDYANPDPEDVEFVNANYKPLLNCKATINISI